MFTGRIRVEPGRHRPTRASSPPEAGPAGRRRLDPVAGLRRAVPRLSGRTASRMVWSIPVALRHRCRRVEHRAGFFEAGPGEPVPGPSRQLPLLDLVGGHVRDRRPLSPCGPRRHPDPPHSAAWPSLLLGSGNVNVGNDGVVTKVNTGNAVRVRFADGVTLDPWLHQIAL